MPLWLIDPLNTLRVMKNMAMGDVEVIIINSFLRNPRISPNASVVCKQLSFSRAEPSNAVSILLLFDSKTPENNGTVDSELSDLCSFKVFK